MDKLTMISNIITSMISNIITSMISNIITLIGLLLLFLLRDEICKRIIILYEYFLRGRVYQYIYNNRKKLLVYYATFFIPSSTFGYIILHDYMNYGIVISYLVSNLIAATTFIPINIWIFKKEV